MKIIAFLFVYLNIILYLCPMKEQIEILSSEKSLETNADVIIVNNEIFTYKSTGLTRRVFVNADKTKVIKVPVEKNYKHFNVKENEIYNDVSDDIKMEMAKTTLLNNGYIEQEYLHSLDDKDTLEWLGRPMTMKEIRFATSCRDDVGFDENRVLKCFDLEEYKKY